MKKIKRILVVIIYLTLILYIGAILFINTKGENIVAEQLEASLKEEVSMKKLRYAFPLGIQAEELKIGEVFEAVSLSAQIDITSLATERITIHLLKATTPNITIKNASSNPKVILERIEQKPKSQAKDVEVESTQKKAVKKIIIKKVVINDGVINYSDDKGKKLEFSIEDVYLNLSDLPLPMQDANTSFQLSGRLDKDNSPFTGSNVSASGWVNWFRRDMDGKLMLQDQSGSAGLSADLKSEANDLNVEGRVNIKNFIAVPEQKTDSINNIILSALSGLDVDSQFSFKTQMDDVDIGPITFTGNVGVRE